MTVGTGDDLGPLFPTMLAALDVAGIGMLVVAGQIGALRRVYCNRSAAAQMGYTVAEMQALPVLTPIFPSERDRTRDQVGRIVAGAPTPALIETKLQHRDGSAIPVDLIVTRVPASALGESEVGYIIVIRSYAEHRPVQTSMLEADRIAVVGALAAGIAHEINNPLTYVLLHLRNLRRSTEHGVTGEAISAVSQLIDEAHAGADRIRNIVRTFMTFASPPTATPVAVDLCAVTNGALRLLTPVLEHRARVVPNMSPVLPVLGDESRLGHAVLSMLLFAGSDFATDDPAHNRVFVAVECKHNEVVVEISDNGRDVVIDAGKSVFEPFYRPRGSSSIGAGLGLAVPHAIASSLSGSLDLAPRAGGGVVLTLRLPVNDGQVRVTPV